jgi:hypothetical protein
MPDEADIEIGEEPPQEPQIPLEQKSREQMRQIISQKIELPPITDVMLAFLKKTNFDHPLFARFLALRHPASTTP